MNMLDMLMQAGGGQAVNQIAGKFGLSPEQTQGAIGQLLPAVMGGFKKQAQGGGLDQLLQGLGGGAQAYSDDAQAVTQPGAVDAGNAILGQIFGSKDVSRAVAGQAAQSTGLDAGILKQLLPVVAAMAAGGMAKQAGGGAPAGGGLMGMVAGMLGGAGQQGQSGGIGGLLSMLDADKDGNPLDDILGMVNKLR
jgi:hypothetical protein